MLQRIRSVVYGAVLFSVVLQISGSSVAFALDEASSPSGVSTLAAPTGGSPHSVVQTSNNFSFTWHAVAPESTVRYQLRISSDPVQVGKAPDVSMAWYSEELPTTAMLATIAPLRDGLWYWQVRTVAASDKSNWSEVWSVQVDTVGPAISISRPLGGVMGNEPISFLAEMVDASDLADFTVELDGQTITDQVARDSGGQTTRLSKSWAPGQLAEGTHELKLLATDIHGHSSEAARSFEVDTKAPDATISMLEGQTLNGIIPVEIRGNELGTYTIQITSDGREIFAGSNADSQVESPSGYRYEWNTWSVPNGTYDITFTAKDSLNNETSLTRRVIVANTLITGVVVNDPLLEELSAQLSQPLIPPKASDTVGATAIVADPPKVNDLSPEQEVFLKTVPDFVPVAATENGWRLFGVLWYWWLLGGLVLAGTSMMIKRNIDTSFSHVPDGV